MGTTFEIPFISSLCTRFEEPDPLIQVILGPRQVGKTTGFLQCLKRVKRPSHYVSADNLLNPEVSWILEQWQEAKLKSPQGILAIDEIQKIPNWSETIKQLWDEQKKQGGHLRVVLMGSSSLTLQKGLSESLTGRFELIRLQQWNYYESCQIRKMSVEEYLTFGGYPGSYAYL